MCGQEWHDTIQSDTTDESAVPDPEIPVAEGSDRDPRREKLWNLAATELRRVTEAWGGKIAVQEAPLSPRARDLCVIEISKDLELLRCEERSCVREFSRLMNELRKLQKEAEAPQQQARTSDQPSQAQASASEDESREEVAENAGASGYVEEKRCEQPGIVSTNRPPAPTQPQPGASPSPDIFTDLPPVVSTVAHTGALLANGRGGTPASPRAEAA
jgi:hypothetical protein